LNIIKTILFISSLLICNLSFADSGSQKEAEKFLNSLDMENSMNQSVDQMVSLQLSQNPALAPYKEIMQTFFNKHMSYKILKADLINIYANAFTESELQEINAFYQTPTGKKTIKQMPLLMRKGGEIGAERIKKNMPELQQLIKAESERTKKAVK
jgi:hypothetical protein